MDKDTIKKASIPSASLVVIVAVLFSKCGFGIPGVGAGSGGSDNDSSAASAVESQIENNDAQLDLTEAATVAEEVTSIESSETEYSAQEIVIEIKKDHYYIDGTEVTLKKIEDLLESGNTSFKIDNNYGSNKAVNELKVLFNRYNVSFIE